MEKYYPHIIKMVDLSHTAVTRRAAANILAETANLAATLNVFTESLLHAYLCLCQDTDIFIRKAMIRNYHTLIHIIKNPHIESQLFAEVMKPLNQ